MINEKWSKQVRIDEVHVLEQDGKRIYHGRCTWPDGSIDRFYFEVDLPKTLNFTEMLHAKWLAHLERINHGAIE